MTNITSTKTVEKHSNVSTTLTKQTKSKFGKSIFTTSSNEVHSGKEKKDVANDTITTSRLETKQTLEQTKRNDERNHSEEGFFRRFIHRSGRKQKKERDTSADSDTHDAGKLSAKKAEISTTPAIKKSAELSIINVLSNARANETPIGPKASPHVYGSAEELDIKNSSPKSLVMRNDKLRSGPIARQRYTKDITQTIIDSERMHSSDVIDAHSPMQRQSPHLMRKEFSTSYLRFSPTKSSMSQSCDGDGDKFVNRASHYRSAEMLHTTTSSSMCDSNNTFDMDDLDAENEQQRHGIVDDGISSHHPVSLPKTVWPNDTNNKFNSPNVSRNGYGWGQCQQKISKMNDHHQHHHHHHHQQQHQHSSQTTKSHAKSKPVEKSKSFRLYTKNFNNDTAAPTRNECKTTLCPSLPDLNAPNRSPLARPSRYSSSNQRENLQSLRFLNSSGNHLNVNSDANAAKWTPTRSSSSSRISEQRIEHRFGNTRFEINEMNLIPTSKLYSTLNTSDEIASYNIESDNANMLSSENDGPNVLPVSTSKSHHHYNQNANIHEIEDNIDKIMKSSVVTVLKKSPTAELYQIKTNSGNVSLTTITTNDEAEGDDGDSGAGDSGALNVAMIENPPLLRHSTTAAKLDLQVPSLSPPKKIVSKLPEFMQIQLNRVDASRPKSCIEYSSSATSLASNNNATVSFDMRMYVRRLEPFKV